MKHSYFRKSLVLFFGLLPVLAMAQTPLQYQLDQQGGGNCAGSPVELSVSTSVHLTTNDASEITVNTAISGGNVTNDGGNAVSQRGVCWNTSPNPTTANFSTSDGSGLGNFSSNLSGLSPNATYYVRAYAINSVGTFYGNEVSFITGNAANPTAHTCGAENVHNPNLTYSTMTDQEGNVYKTIVIGTQEWMAENLKTSTYRNGDLIPNVTDNAQWAGLTSGAWCYYNNDPQFECPYGKLYKGFTVIDPRNICPTGWTIPTRQQWTQLASTYSINNSAGANLKSQCCWGPGFEGNNISGFSGLGGGGRGGVSGLSDLINDRGTWWSLTQGTIASSLYTFTLYISASFVSTQSENNRQGYSVRCIKEESVLQGSINNIDCGSANNNGTLTQGTAASGVSSLVPYTGGNGGLHNGQTVTSTGVTGLTATLAAGTFANGAGSLTYTITGTPSASGTASFELNIGGQSCTLVLSVGAPIPTYPPGSVFCNGTPTAVVEVLNPATGRIWMDRNLGASQAATSSTDEAAYGDLYQWGRGADGHQCRNSATTTTLSSTDQPGHGDFIIAIGSPSSPKDWRIEKNNNLWQGVNGINNPCPSGYRLPTEIELQTERNSWGSFNSAGAFDSPLKFTVAGWRNGGLNGFDPGALLNVGITGYYWSSTLLISAIVNDPRALNFSTNAGLFGFVRATGFPVRCIKD